MTTTSTVGPKTLLSAEQFLESLPESGSFELVRGEVVELPPPGPEHGRICLKVGFVLESFGRRSGLGYALTNDTATLTARGPDTVRGADVSYYTRARLPEAEIGNRLAPIAPDLVVEVNSPSNRPSEMRDKVKEYLDAGVLMVWVVYPSQRLIAISRPGEAVAVILTDSDDLENLPELLGFRCPVAELLL